jgi:GMP synthase (glutamine-hydrolysing)
MNRPVLVVDFGAQYAQLIARRVREANVYSEIVHHNITAAEVQAKNPLAIILSGGPSSVYEAGSPQLDKKILELGIPVLGICYGFQILASVLGGRVDATGKKEYGATELRVTAGGEILEGQPAEQVCWMSHGDQVMQAPEGFEVLASTDTTPVAAFSNSEKKIYGVQWHPEVKHSAFGQNVLENFLHKAAGIPATWNSGNVIAEQVEKIRAQVGNDRVICGLSGGVDSAVAAALVHKAVGDQLVCVFVNHGLLRQDEAEQVERDYVAATGIRLVVVDAEQKFLEALDGDDLHARVRAREHLLERRDDAVVDELRDLVRAAARRRVGERPARLARDLDLAARHERDEHGHDVRLDDGLDLRHRARANVGNEPTWEGGGG